MSHIAITRPLPEAGLARLRRSHTLTIHDPVQDGEADEDRIIALARDAEALIPTVADPITARVLEASSHLKVVAQFGVGVDNIDLEAATRKGVLVINAPDGNTISTAEHTCAMLMALAYPNIAEACERTIPGYGMAVAQAQGPVRELMDLLVAKGVDVQFAIHPVAGRMPGHMNVLLAEANVPYDRLQEMDEINDDFADTDVALVIGANDVVNPLAREEGSPISGMPILNVDAAQNIIVLKRGRGTGFAGIPNPLFSNERTSMLFGDARPSVESLVAGVKQA